MFSSDDLSSLRWDATSGAVEVIDQTLLPHTLRWVHLESLEDYCHAISAMQVRGAPLIGITAAFGLAHGLRDDSSDQGLAVAYDKLLATRPTAVNLRWALEQVRDEVGELMPFARAEAAWQRAVELRAEDIASCARIGEVGLPLLREAQRGDTLNVMTHCNAGWLATIQWGTALAPVYKAVEAGLNVHVWVSETRPRNQGVNLSAWELQRAGVPCTVVADNSCGQLMREGLVDCVVVGSDRTAANGDVCNKIGTYLKALAATDNNIPFYVALPASTVDWRCDAGEHIPIEARDSGEVLAMAGVDGAGESRQINLAAAGTRAANPAFDVTPARLVSALITEHGCCTADPAGLQALRAQLYDL
ncbi:S-methyl-5-thioribose-1-phosphate isomerase [Halioglobus japonicus]|uniref:Methylthioribose-1-phosphate isomerase n=1 Tax=Halioglobus japonicus TaxID=930805 RepID=A0AAP8MCM7_9GAMM|nr:S-methyl-5-thioribose-1-phosphate isomerase [Halioglobus japonicus]AQA17202.1 S-methyl-5-thioribose-1-phosphate isomerase [Halioglobus japonicus]PLW85117.1 S-methyl-5-thioribose-1-phosphate isomerase [Halioglobus japonicus]GHD19534.1 methylthioribose-1-phosphate isomerase [Halioglobus japonicus]